MNIDPVAIYTGNVVIYWSGLIICLGIMAGFFIALALYSGSNATSAAIWFFLPFAIILSVLICRIMHWYCHQEQYLSWYNALTDYSNGSYCLQGTLLGVYISALIVKVFGLEKNTGSLLDAVAPGFALTIALIRLSSLFNNSCHSKYSVENKIFQGLPIGILTEDTAGNHSYKFASFFVEFMVMMIIFTALIILYYSLHNARMKAPCKRDGHIFKIFLLLFSCVELLIDSTRNDSSFLHFPGQMKVLNKFFGFIGLAQLISAIIIVTIFIYYTKRSAQANGKNISHIVIIVLFAVSLVTAGAMEYCVQRWTNMFRGIYVVMTAATIIMMVCTLIMYRRCISDNYRYEIEYDE